MSIDGRGFPWPVLGAMLGLAGSSAAATFAVQTLRGKKTAKTDAVTTGMGSLASLAAWEGAWWIIRRNRRSEKFIEARSRADQLGKQLVVVGAPDGGPTSGYGCGDITIDLAGSDCPNSMKLDITKTLPFANDSVVVFCSCVLEYVSDPCAAITELKRIGGSNTFFVGVEPWTLTGLYFPGAKQTLPVTFRGLPK